MNPEITITETLVGIVLAVGASYLLTVFAAWLCNHPQPLKFWRPEQ